MTPEVVTMLSRALGPGRAEKDGSEYRFHCPYCRQTKPYLSVNPKKRHQNGVGVFQCWFCGEKGSLARLCYKVGVPYEDVPMASPTEYEAALRYIMGRQKHEALGRIDYQLEIGEDYWPRIPEFTHAWQYLMSRGMAPDDVQKYRFGVGVGRYRNRIVLPEFVDDVMTFFQARAYDGREPRYLSPSGSRDYHLWNLDRVAALYDKVHIAEGVFSGIACGPEGVGIYSYNYLPGQVQALASAKFDEYVIVFDGEHKAITKADQLARDLTLFGIPERVIKIALVPQGMDPDDVGKTGMTPVIAAAVPWSHDFMFEFNGGLIRWPTVNSAKSANCQNGRSASM